jgi:iron complex transport system substrate-binding protein
MRRLNTIMSAAALLLLAAAAGCDERSPGAQAAPSDDGGSRTITDDLGREVSIAGDIERIAVASPFAVEYLMALDHPPVLRPDIPAEEVRPEAAVSIPTLAVSHSVGPNLEQLVAADPDLVILSPTFARFTDTIEDATEAPVLVYRIDAIADVPAKARTFGRLIGKPERGAALAQRMHERIAAITPPADVQGPEVFALFGTPQAFFAFLPDSYLGSMVEHLGGTLITEGSPAANLSTQLTPFSMEYLIEADPDVILMVHHGPAGEMVDELREHPAWSGLTAVREGRVHRVSQWLFMMHPGPRANEALNVLRPLLYPKVADERSG